LSKWLPPQAGKYMSVGVELAAAFILGLVLGYQADRWTGSFPLWTTVGMAAGIALGFYNLYMKLTDHD
jgi:F0F1-type ATP synthase assembly protein I